MMLTYTTSAGWKVIFVSLVELELLVRSLKREFTLRD